MPLFSLQYLRGVAALMVVLVHLQLQLGRVGYQGAWPDWTAAGVDIFFVLSGFLMWHTTAGRNQSPLEFWRRRIARIVPLYWLLTSLVVLVLVVAPRLMQSVRLDWVNVVASYFFIFTPASSGRLEPVLVVGWTLNYEMLFYLVYGAALALPARWRFGATALVIVALVAVDYPAFGRSGVQAVRGSSLMLEFVFGMAVAAAWRWFARPGAGTAANLGAGWALLLGGFLAMPLAGGLWPDLPPAIAGGLPATAIVCGALWLERCGALPRLPALRWLGDLSFSLYLSHPIVLSAFTQLWMRAGLNRLPGGSAWFGVAAVLACLLVGWAVYRLAELPLTRRFNAYTGARLSPRAPAHVS
jgi:exopolysaccharide production protein ExoZ